MSVPHKEGNVAGYHICWTLNTKVELTGIDAVMATPLADLNGEALVVPSMADFDARLAQAAPG